MDDEAVKAKAHEIGVKARKLLAHHWDKGTYVNRVAGTFCMVGAVNVAAGCYPRLSGQLDSDDEFAASRRLLLRTIAECISARGTTYPAVEHFNDSNSTGHHDVMSVMDCAVEKTA